MKHDKQNVHGLRHTIMLMNLYLYCSEVWKQWLLDVLAGVDQYVYTRVIAARIAGVEYGGSKGMQRWEMIGKRPHKVLRNVSTRYDVVGICLCHSIMRIDGKCSRFMITGKVWEWVRTTNLYRVGREHYTCTLCSHQLMMWLTLQVVAVAYSDSIISIAVLLTVNILFIATGVESCPANVHSVEFAGHESVQLLRLCRGCADADKMNKIANVILAFIINLIIWVEPTTGEQTRRRLF